MQFLGVGARNRSPTWSRTFPHIKDWTKHFFFVLGLVGYPKGEAIHQEFPVSAVWRVVLDNKDISFTLSK